MNDFADRLARQGEQAWQAQRAEANCTHGADCTVHPDVNGLHNFDPTVEDVLRAVLAKIAQRREEGEMDLRQVANDVRQIAINAGVTL